MDTYQQVEIFHKCWGFSAKSIALDGIPPHHLRRECWDVFGTESSSQPFAVQKWYCPFAFVHEEEMELKDQMKRSTFYEVILDQGWDKIFSSDNTKMTKNKVVFVDFTVQKEGLHLRSCWGW
ncbi:hypothetical protein FEM48_Zijuj10G0020200 [Ziziphus jujuba var. spinosa]|uniref:Uncharacterized protein n=1 Tax=Ziziphus jujuba var. spinosa TaxID=714518 RepID=A0A978UKM7_ZIZJJ|nr:hypothetical protein FEM48_Zijuj10G0020200 [Ziziphus jujuba var. spinosa]